MKLPVSFVSGEYDKNFLALHAGAFAELLKEADKSEKFWSAFLFDLRKHGLLTFCLERFITLPPFVIEPKAARGGGKVEKIHVDLKKPIPFGFDRHEIHLERKRLAEPAYLEESSAILAYMWAWKLLPAAKNFELEVLLKTNKSLLSSCLRKLHRGQSSAAGVARFILAENINSLLDDLPALKSFDALKERLSANSAN